MKPSAITHLPATPDETPRAYRNGVPIALTGELAWLAVPAKPPR